MDNVDNINKVIKSFEPMMHKLLHKYKIRKDYDDYLQALRITTYSVIKKYDPSKAKLSTVLYKSFENKIKSLLNSEDKQAIPESAFTKDTLGCIYKRGIIDNYSRKPDYLINNVDYNFLLEKLKQQLNTTEKQILKYKIMGLNQQEIGIKINKSQQRVSQQLEIIRNKLKAVINDGR